MIERVSSTLATFKELRFGPGLNVLLADKSPGATERQPVVIHLFAGR